MATTDQNPAKQSIWEDILPQSAIVAGRGLPIWLRTMIPIVLAFTAFGVIRGIVDLARGGNIEGFFGKLIGFWSWALLFPLIVFVDRRLRFSDKRLHLRLCMHLLLTLPFALAQTIIASLAEFPLVLNWWDPLRRPEYAYYYIIDGCVCYVAIIGALYAIRYYGRFLSSQIEKERLKGQLLQAQIHNLRMQLEPHFVANALNAISSEVERDPSLARQIIEDLGVLLRLSHAYKDRQLIPLMEEMALLDHYLDIQRVRFGNRLTIVIDIDPAARWAAVPNLLIQPLVENAIRHGLSGAHASGTVTIKANRIGDRIEIRVEDDGVGLPPGWRLEQCSGQGLTVTRDRLTALYQGNNSSFIIGPRMGSGTEVTITIPLQRVEVEE